MRFAVVQVDIVPILQQDLCAVHSDNDISLHSFLLFERIITHPHPKGKGFPKICLIFSAGGFAFPLVKTGGACYNIAMKELLQEFSGCSAFLPAGTTGCGAYAVRRGKPVFLRFPRKDMLHGASGAPVCGGNFLPGRLHGRRS